MIGLDFAMKGWEKYVFCFREIKDSERCLVLLTTHNKPLSKDFVKQKQKGTGVSILSNCYTRSSCPFSFQGAGRQNVGLCLMLRRFGISRYQQEHLLADLLVL